MPRRSPLSARTVRPRQALHRVAALLALTVVAGCGRGNAPVNVTPPTPNGSEAAACARLAVEVPTRLEGHRVRVTSPKSPRVVAWGNPPIVLRCGVARPPGYDPAGSVTVIDGVDWWQRVDGKTVRWTVVGRAAYVELAVPTSYDEQGVFLVDLAGPLKKALPVVAGR